MSESDDKAGMHHYPWHPGDYQLATNHWSELRTKVECEAGLLHDLAYRRLIDLYYGLGGPIPDKTQWVATRVRMLAHAEIVGLVLKEKFTREPGFWRNDKCDKEIAKYRKRVVANQENGKKGGRKPNGNPVGNPLGSKPRTKNHKPRNIPPTPQMGEWFEEWYAHYPLKKGRQQALVNFLKLLPDRTLVDAMVTAIQAQVAARHFDNASGVMVAPHPGTWITDRRWEDAITEPAAKAGDKPWWEKRSAVIAKGLELGLQPPPEGDNEAFFGFMARVWAKLGDGPWLDAESRAYPIYKRLLDEMEPA